MVFIIVKVLSNFILVYGKRRLVLSLLLGFILGYLTKNQDFLINYIDFDYVVIGNIIPGLIANWMDRQGALRTLCTILISASVTKLFILNLIVFQIIK